MPSAIHSKSNEDVSPTANISVLPSILEVRVSQKVSIKGDNLLPNVKWLYCGPFSVLTIDFGYREVLLVIM